MGIDGTPVGPGASAAAADKAITSMKADTDPAGSVFSTLKLNSTKQAKTSVTLKWAKGSCYVYAYAQNGVAKKIKVVVK